jgi:hypothetical protein
VKTIRRYISRALARAAFHVDPDPPLKFTTTRRVTLTADGDADDFVSALSGVTAEIERQNGFAMSVRDASNDELTQILDRLGRKIDDLE